MAEKKVYSQSEMEKWIKHLISEMPKHKTSDETRQEFSKIYKALNDLPKKLGCGEHSVMLDRHEKAIYGDEHDKTSPGMKVQLDEMHKFFIGARGSSKLVIYFFGGVGTIAFGVTPGFVTTVGNCLILAQRGTRIVSPLITAETYLFINNSDSSVSFMILPSG